MKLLCVSPYANLPARLEFAKGQVLDVTDAVGAFLLADSPASFQVMGAKVVVVEDTIEAKEVEAPPMDKMVRRQTTTTKKRR